MVNYLYCAFSSGTAEGFANILKDDAIKHGFDARAVDLKDFVAEELKKSWACIFMIATYGDGGPTDNSTDFMKWLDKPVGGGRAYYVVMVAECCMMCVLCGPGGGAST